MEGLRFAVESTEGVMLRADKSLYSQKAVEAAAYWFTADWFVHLEDEPEATVVRIVRKSDGTRAGGAQTVGGEFANRLLDEALREKVGAETEAVRNAILAHALSETPLLGTALDAADVGDDPLGIR